MKKKLLLPKLNLTVTCFISENRMRLGTSTMLSCRNFLRSHSGLEYIRQGKIVNRHYEKNHMRKSSWCEIQLIRQKQLPFHQTHAIKVNTVKNKKAHVGVLKGGFLGGHSTGQELELKMKKGAKLLEKQLGLQAKTLWTPRVPKGSGLLVFVSIRSTSASSIILWPPGKAWGM